MPIPEFVVAAGFDAAVLEELPPEARHRLARIALLRQAAFLAIALATGIAANISMHGGLAGWTVGTLFGLGTWLLVSRMGRLLMSAGGPGVALGEAAVKDWKPGIIWPAFLFVAALLATQPLLLAVGWGGTAQRIGMLIDDRVAVHLSRQRDVLVAADNRLQLQRAQLSERLAVGGAAVPGRGTIRKALVIGAQQYVHAGVLINPAKDARDLAAKLQSMGFAVALSVDDPADSLQLKIFRYINGLNPGDISVFAYSGHGYQRDGHNYLVPVDFDAERVPGIQVTRILEAVSRRSPQLQVIILDACRSFESDGFRVSTGGLAVLDGGTNSFIAMAAKPGKVALDGTPGVNGLFTAAILRHIASPADINVVFRRVSADVSAQASRRDFTQEPVVTSTLQREYVQLIDPVRVAPQGLPTGGEPLAGGEAARKSAQRTPTEVCAAPPGYAAEQQREIVRTCLRRRMQAIDSMLAQWQQAGSSRLTENTRAYRRSLNDSGLLRERLSDMWTGAPVSLALVSLLVAVLLCAGEGLVWLHQRDLASYFERRNRRAIEQLERSHARNDGLVEQHLTAVRPESFRAFDRFRTTFDWKGPVASPPLWTGNVTAPTSDQRAAIEGWITAMGRRSGGAR